MTVSANATHQGGRSLVEALAGILPRKQSCFLRELTHAIKGEAQTSSRPSGRECDWVLEQACHLPSGSRTCTSTHEHARAHNHDRTARLRMVGGAYNPPCVEEHGKAIAILLLARSGFMGPRCIAYGGGPVANQGQASSYFSNDDTWQIVPVHDSIYVRIFQMPLPYISLSSEPARMRGFLTTQHVHTDREGLQIPAG